MKEIWNSSYRNIFLFGLLCIIIAAWYSIGFHQIDEHFMILEFANFKYGTVPQRVVPWEFTEQIRPTLLPTVVYCLFQFFKAIHINDPFLQVFLLRLLVGILSWFVVSKIAIIVAQYLQDKTVQRWWMTAVNCLWFIPYLQVRVSSENLAGMCLLASFLVVSNIFDKTKVEASNSRWFFAGLLLAGSFYFRFQIAFSILGLLIWLLLYARPLWKSYLFIFLGALVAIVINLLVDRWFYGHWVFTPYRYYDANIVRNVASSYGVTPWYDYILLFLNLVIPPISWVLLLLFFIGLYKYPKQFMVFIVVPFLIGHIMVPHKEFRFLFPIAIPFLAICFFGLQSVWSKIQYQKWVPTTFKLLVVINILLLAYRCYWPANPSCLYYKFLYQYTSNKPTKFITLGRGIFDEGHNEIYLYRPPLLDEDTMPENVFPSYVQQQNADSILVMSYRPVLDYKDSRYTATRLYICLPDWVMNIQLNDWQSRTDLWSIWLLRKQQH